MSQKNFIVSPDQIAKFRAELAALGTTLPDGNTGKFSPPGHPEISLAFEYDGTANLTITILDDAWYETAGEIWDGLAPYLA